MTVKLIDVLDVLRDFADTGPNYADWEMIGNMVDEFLDDHEAQQRELQFDRYDYLPEEDDYYYNDDYDYNERPEEE
jgi:hypothetical protein